LQWTPIVNAIGYELDRGRGDYFAPDYPYMHALSEPQLTMLLSDGSRRLVPSNVWREATPIQIRTTDGSGSLPQQIADALNVAAERLGLPNRRPWIGPVGEEWNGREWEPLPGTRP
jgi:hypothetical protein